MPAPLIPDSPPPLAGDTVLVTAAELETTLSVWLKTAPPRIWTPYLKMLTIDRTRRNEEDRADPRELLASYLATKFTQAHWRATRIQPEAMVDRSGSTSNPAMDSRKEQT